MGLVTNATEDDLPGILAIFNDVIATTTAVYREEPVSLEERRTWMRTRLSAGYPVLVAHQAGEVAGFASFGEFRAWPCYRHSVEHTVHVRSDLRRQGIGRALLQAVVDRASSAGKHVLVAGIDADNAGSLRLHQQLGFAQVGRFREVGYKFNRWLDLVFLQRMLP